MKKLYRLYYKDGTTALWFITQKDLEHLLVWAGCSLTKII
jgi:hypothetical protein